MRKNMKILSAAASILGHHALAAASRLFKKARRLLARRLDSGYNS